MVRGASRPLLKLRIDRLEELFTRSRSNLEQLRNLDQELKHRSTARALRLRAQVAKAISDAGQNNPGTSPQVWPVEAPAGSVAMKQTSTSLSSPERRSAERIAAERIAVDRKLPTEPSTMWTAPREVNHPESILSAWTALEALSPQTYKRPEDLAGGDRRCVVDLWHMEPPWIHGERSRPEKALFYQILLGSISMEAATVELVKAFGEDEEVASFSRTNASIAAILVNQKGLLVEEKGIAVSSFAWALPIALERKLEQLGIWPQMELSLIEKLEAIFRRLGDDGAPLPLDLPTIEEGYRWLVAFLGVPQHLLEPPRFVLRVYHYYKSKNPPEPLLLNSFFLRDLAKCSSLASRDSIPAGLRQYLGADKPQKIVDLLAEWDQLEKAVAPAEIPLARWPSPGGHPLVLLQQAAVNLVRRSLVTSEGIAAINGPPGTGKTTLLRDIVAACVLDRALAMTEFEDPQTAFSPTGHKVPLGDNAFFHLYSLDPTLKGHEILVASSNNKAVENISRELPITKAIGRTVEELRYFKTVSDWVHRSDESEAASGESLETWGMIAAVLGNAKNRAAFQRAFWWHEDFGFRIYLKAAKGDSVLREIKDANGRVLERKTPDIVLAERPPTQARAKSNWDKARRRLISLKREIEAEQAKIEKVRQTCLLLARVEKEIEGRESALGQLKEVHARALAHQDQLETDAAFFRQTLEEHSTILKGHRSQRPGLLHWLFRTERWKIWAAASSKLANSAAQAAKQAEKAQHALSEAEAKAERSSREVREAEAFLASLRQKSLLLSKDLDNFRQDLGNRIIDEHFFAQGHEAQNLTVPWLPDSLHRKREDLFIAALEVHRAFVDVAAQKVLHNLSVLMDIFSTGATRDEGKRKLLADLWSTLFLVVPVISTTFASVERMLGDLPAGSLGWLLIDEAGQATPQAAVGAVLRAKRSIVVGDPMQIPPVVTLPSRLSFQIFSYFGVDPSAWASPEASTQSLADRASQFQATFRSDQGLRRVGLPLLVHRRCQEPMFGISNAIAYDGQMVLAPRGRLESGVGRVLGHSKWFDIDGEAETKWCREEGEQVVSLLRAIADAGVSEPDVFIVTPFRIVAQELRKRLEREVNLFQALQVEADKWIHDRVGTIHTVQGREAEAVFLVLGAPKASQHGARSWAAGTPNIFNVAVSRAKLELYVVGSFGAWSGIGYGRDLSKLPRFR